MVGQGLVFLLGFSQAIKRVVDALNEGGQPNPGRAAQPCLMVGQGIGFQSHQARGGRAQRGRAAQPWATPGSAAT